MLIELKEKDFKKIIPESKEKPILIYFWAPWATGSTSFMPQIDKLAKKMMNEAKFISIDTEENMNLVKEYKIKTVPTVIILKNEEVTHTLTGLIEENHIHKAIKKHI